MMTGRTLCSSAACVLSLACAAPVVAQQFQPPEGCTGFLTVQSRTCKVSNHWTCSGDAAGDKWRVDIGPNGPNFVSRINNEAEWVESYSLFPTRESKLVTSADPMSMTELLGNGVDTYDFTLSRHNGTEQVAGFDQIIGEAITVDGETLLPTSYSATAKDAEGEVVWERAGNEFVSPRHRMFFSGSGTNMRNGEEVPYDFSPVEFIYPGEEGFFASRPKYDCDSLSAGLPPFDAGVLPAAFLVAPDAERSHD